MNLLIIIPCYNEEKRLPSQAFIEYLATNNQDISFLFVNDGSHDQTSKVLFELREQNQSIYVLDNSQNKGKAEAIRSGMEYALKNMEFDYIGFFDADLATPLYEIQNLGKIAFEKKSLMVVCSRIKRLGSNIDRKVTRHFSGRIFATCTSFLLMLPVYDTQCGAKIIRRDVAKQIFKDPFNSRWFFDIELFARIILHYGYQEALNGIYEYPMQEWIEKGGSKIKFKDFLKTPIELLRLNKIYHKQIKKIK